MYRKFTGLMSVVLLLAAVGPALALDYVWDGGGDGTSWNDPLNWNWDWRWPGYRSNSDWAVIEPGVTPGPIVDYFANNCYGQIINGVLTIAESAPDCADQDPVTCNYIGSKGGVFVGRSTGSVGHVIIEPYSWYTAGWHGWVGIKHLNVGHFGATGTVDCSGTMYMSNRSGIYLGFYDASDPATPRGQGTLNVYEPAVINARFLNIGWGGDGEINLYGGTLYAYNGGNLVIHVGAGSEGVGALNVYGGELYSNGRLNLSRDEGSVGHVQQDGGLINVVDIYEWDGEGTMDMTGDSEMIVRWNNEANTATRKGRINSYINAGKITSYGGEGIFHIQNIWHEREDGSSDIDCHLWPIPPLETSMDILPNDDPNLFTVNMDNKGRLPIDVYGSEDVDANMIDVDSITIADTVIPVKLPKVIGDENGDGLDDLKVLVSKRDLILALGLDQMEPGAEVTVTLEGTLIQQQFEVPTGRPFSATDTIILVARED